MLESFPPVADICPETFDIDPAWEVMGQWEDPNTHSVKFWIRFFCVDSQGKQVGRDAFSRVLDSLEFLSFMACRRRSATVFEPRELTSEDQERIAEILRARNPPTSFLQHVGAYLAMIRRKAGGLDRRPFRA